MQRFKPNIIRALTAIALVSRSAAIAASNLPQDNWPQWRGPQANGVAPTAKPPLTWSETNHVKWKVKLPGTGTATPIIWGDQIFIQTAIPSGLTEKAATPEKPAAASDAPNQAPQRRPGGGMRSEKPTQPYRFTLLCLDLSPFSSGPLRERLLSLEISRVLWLVRFPG